ncbi:TadE/TadG family type IV pilus assembly protein [Nocardiopsis tropica]|uniref:Pilus assembly protein TadE n=1 Tax=Nocardiopsis tropica TaxID=109330 RepID=A0ABU7KYF1_9ACTN|nr:TadE/TadG family type IV pilus assembly protein [Nocardiopsis umidischolae]MEE2054311.1 pilus assembly protein TadE [Nocardiopsis umidischolae]
MSRPTAGPGSGRGGPTARGSAPGRPRGGAARRLPLGGRAGRDADRGGPLLEFAAFFPILLLTAVVAIEAFLAFVAVERLESAARAGARVAGAEQLPGAEAAAREALPSWLDDATVTSGTNDSEGFYVEVSHPLPIVFSSSGLDLTLTRRVDMPNV